jgi:hypothetical protein
MTILNDPTLERMLDRLHASSDAQTAALVHEPVGIRLWRRQGWLADEKACCCERNTAGRMAALSPGR